MNDKEFLRRADEMRKTCVKNYLMGKTIRPYGYKMTIDQLVNSHGWLHIREYTKVSKDIIKSELAMLEEIIREDID